MKLQKQHALNSFFLLFISTMCASSQLFSSQPSMPPKTESEDSFVDFQRELATILAPESLPIAAAAAEPAQSAPAATETVTPPASILGKPYTSVVKLPEQQPNAAYTAHHPLDPRRLLPGADDKGPNESPFDYVKRTAEAGKVLAAIASQINFDDKLAQATTDMASTLTTVSANCQRAAQNMTAERRNFFQRNFDNLVWILDLHQTTRQALAEATPEAEQASFLSGNRIATINAKLRNHRHQLDDELCQLIAELTEQKNATIRLEQQVCNQHPDPSQLRAPTPPTDPSQPEEIYLQMIRRKMRSTSPTTQKRLLQDAEDAVYMKLDEERKRRGILESAPRRSPRTSATQTDLDILRPLVAAMTVAASRTSYSPSFDTFGVNNYLPPRSEGAASASAAAAATVASTVTAPAGTRTSTARAAVAAGVINKPMIPTTKP